MFTCPVKVREAAFQGRICNLSTSHIFIFTVLSCHIGSIGQEVSNRLTRGANGPQRRILQAGIASDQIGILVFDG